MNVSCPDCRSIFRVDPAKVPPGGVRARCSVCSGVISIPAPSGSNTPAASAPRAATPAAPRMTPQPAAPTPSRPSQPAAQNRSAESASAARTRPDAMEWPSASATATPPSPAGGISEFRTPTPPPFNPPPFPPSAQPAAFNPAAPSASSAPPFVPSQPRPATPVPPRPTAPVTPPRPATVSPTPAAPAAAPVAPSASGESGARRPLNPFLSKDPNQRAKRLARALVSDIVTYHPAKHAEGLRDGTLKQLFREEIKKSFEEYIAQVGQQLAESTTYFQEALNEVLGAGKKIF
jgi:predicted Zn finger-like uncharacterized protein